MSRSEWKEEELLSLSLSVPPVSSPGLRARLLRSVTAEPFSPFVGRLSSLFDLGRSQVETLLLKMENSWEKTPWDGIFFMHIQGGLRTVGCDVGLVRVEAGQAFPYHTHGGEEQVLVLQGGFLDSDGTVYRSGDFIRAVAAHHFTALPEVMLLYAVVVPGVEFPGL